MTQKTFQVSNQWKCLHETRIKFEDQKTLDTLIRSFFETRPNVLNEIH